jgi:hypothetical protein
MTRAQVQELLEDLCARYEGDSNPPLERDNEVYDPPTESDWAFLRERFGTTFSREFIDFMELIQGYNCPNVLNVTREGRTNGDPTLDWTYDREMSLGMWDADMLPFLALGDGSFYCVRISAGARSAVYFVDETATADECAPSFEDWLLRLEYFLNG